jgi:hypothetical protein
MKRRLDKALGNDFSKESSIDNINSAITLAKSMKVYDVVDPSGKIMGEIAEIVNRILCVTLICVIPPPPYPVWIFESWFDFSNSSSKVRLVILILERQFYI